MSRSRESRPRGSRKQQTKITFAARARTLNRQKNYHGAQGFTLLAHSLLPMVLRFARAQRSPIAIMGRDRKLKAIDARKFDNDVSVRPYVRTDSGSRGKNSVGREGSPRHVCCILFWQKISHFRGQPTQLLK